MSHQILHLITVGNIIITWSSKHNTSIIHLSLGSTVLNTIGNQRTGNMEHIGSGNIIRFVINNTTTQINMIKIRVSLVWMFLNNGCYSLTR
jgi:hypothetical protein